MSNDNPFGDNNYIDDDKTILRPMPGGRRSQSQEPPPPQPVSRPQSVGAGISDNVREQIAYSTRNPITGAAISLLSLVAQLRNTASHPDIGGLRNNIIEEIKRFELKIKNQGVSTEQAQAARYALCTLLDETVLNTPWGSNSLWGTQSLLILFHKEAWGGEKFFLILKNCMQQPGTHLDLLELLYFALCLGFEGRYRVEDHGSSKLEEIRENAYSIIQRQRGDVERGLSLHWQGIKDKRNVLARLIPFWVIGSIAALLLVLSFLGFLYLINTASDPLFGKLYALKDSFNAPPVVLAEAAPVIQTPTAPPLIEELNSFLKPEVDKGEVVLLKDGNKTIVRIMSKGLFASGSDEIIRLHYPLLIKISQALSQVSGRITVVGHTDSDRMGANGKFSSNWDLSTARALSVENMLKSNNSNITAIMDYEGRADSKPMVANDSPEHKAMNRRVEIEVIL
jgi:type VI secretion system protein ImpK